VWLFKACFELAWLDGIRPGRRSTALRCPATRATTFLGAIRVNHTVIILGAIIRTTYKYAIRRVLLKREWWRCHAARLPPPRLPWNALTSQLYGLPYSVTCFFSNTPSKSERLRFVPLVFRLLSPRRVGRSVP